MTADNSLSRVLSGALTQSRDVLTLRDILEEHRQAGMTREEMLRALEALRKSSDPQTEDVILELMDLVAGFCRPELAVFPGE